MRTKGYTLFEMTIAAGVIAMIGYIYSLFLRNDVINVQGNQLATQTLSYAKTYAKYLSDLQNGKIYITTGTSNDCINYDPFAIAGSNTITIGLNDLTDNFGKRVYDPNNPQLLKCTPTPGSYVNSMLNESNSFRQTPCLGVTKNAAGKFQAFMFYVDSGQNSTIPEYSRDAMIRLNGKGGYFESNGTIRSNGGWGLSASDPRFSNPSHCGGIRISPYSLVINMDQFIEFNDSLSNSVALNRESDLVNQPGTLQNKNTSKSDIYMSSNGTNHNIVFDKDNNVVMSTSGKIVTLTGAFQAASLQGTLQVKSGAACDASQVGAMAQQNDQLNPALGVQQSEAICSDSELVCALYGTRYCWLPAKGNTITYNDAAHTGKLGSRLVCPAYAPFMSYAKGFQQGNSNVTIENIITPITNSNTGQTYNLARGVKAIGDNSPRGCETWGYTAGYGDNNWGRYSCQAGTTYRYPGNCGLSGGTAACDGATKNGKQGWYGRCKGAVQIGPYNCANAGCAGKDWTCTKQGVTPPVILETVTCTSKLVIQAS